MYPGPLLDGFEDDSDEDDLENMEIEPQLDHWDDDAGIASADDFAFTFGSDSSNGNEGRSNSRAHLSATFAQRILDQSASIPSEDHSQYDWLVNDTQPRTSESETPSSSHVPRGGIGSASGPGDAESVRSRLWVLSPFLRLRSEAGSTEAEQERAKAAIATILEAASADPST